MNVGIVPLLFPPRMAPVSCSAHRPFDKYNEWDDSASSKNEHGVSVLLPPPPLSDTDRLPSAKKEDGAAMLLPPAAAVQCRGQTTGRAAQVVWGLVLGG